MSDVTGGDTVADAMARTIERQEKRIAALKAELAEAKRYTEALRFDLSRVLKAFLYEAAQGDGVMEEHAPIVEEAKRTLAGEIRS